MVKNLQCLKTSQICYLRHAEHLDHDTLFFEWPVIIVHDASHLTWFLISPLVMRTKEAKDKTVERKWVKRGEGRRVGVGEADKMVKINIPNSTLLILWGQLSLSHIPTNPTLEDKAFVYAIKSCYSGSASDDHIVLCFLPSHVQTCILKSTTDYY